ncbi:unnamed protein product [Trypanosoma congolense IL3000]|uniref:WGS project CAEQ00000000 data, annotated contig 2213 n=1 Tax=Trypanosoma congolense (strain IL3000) TaxID=1068625 RepID=F9WCC8_TRYCI|nr:unnamed protein product [Trypanosoma congolense IL3000]
MSGCDKPNELPPVTTPLIHTFQLESYLHAFSLEVSERLHELQQSICDVWNELRRRANTPRGNLGARRDPGRKYSPGTTVYVDHQSPEQAVSHSPAAHAKLHSLHMSYTKEQNVEDASQEFVTTMRSERASAHTTPPLPSAFEELSLLSADTPYSAGMSPKGVKDEDRSTTRALHAPATPRVSEGALSIDEVVKGSAKVPQEDGETVPKAEGGIMEEGGGAIASSETMAENSVSALKSSVELLRGSLSIPKSAGSPLSEVTQQRDSSYTDGMDENMMDRNEEVLIESDKPMGKAKTSVVGRTSDVKHMVRHREKDIQMGKAFISSQQSHLLGRKRLSCEAPMSAELENEVRRTGDPSATPSHGSVHSSEMESLVHPQTAVQMASAFSHLQRSLIEEVSGKLAEARSAMNAMAREEIAKIRQELFGETSPGPSRPQSSFNRESPASGIPPRFHVDRNSGRAKHGRTSPLSSGGRGPGVTTINMHQQAGDAAMEERLMSHINDLKEQLTLYEAERTEFRNIIRILVRERAMVRANASGATAPTPTAAQSYDTPSFATAVNSQFLQKRPGDATLLGNQMHVTIPSVPTSATSKAATKLHPQPGRQNSRRICPYETQRGQGRQSRQPSSLQNRAGSEGSAAYIDAQQEADRLQRAAVYRQPQKNEVLTHTVPLDFAFSRQAMRSVESFPPLPYERFTQS